MVDFNDNMFDHFDSEIQVDELNPDYADYLDSLPPSKMEIEFVAECVNCGERFMDFEVEMNNECPTCKAMLRRIDIEV